MYDSAALRPMARSMLTADITPVVPLVMWRQKSRNKVIGEFVTKMPKAILPAVGGGYLVKKICKPDSLKVSSINVLALVK